jgi:phytoene desaturase
LFALFGEKREQHLSLLPVSPWYRLIDAKGRSFDYDADMAQHIAQIATFNAADVAGYQSLLAHSEKLYQKGYVELGDQPFTRWRDFLRAAPHLMALRADRSVSNLIARRITDPSLRQFFSMHSLLVGGDPFQTSSIYTLIHALERRSGIWFAKGGTAKLVTELVALARRQGVVFRFGQEVQALRVDSKQRVQGVDLKHQVPITSDIVVSNLDPPRLYKSLMPAHVRHRHSARRIAKQRYSFGLFVWYFGTKRRYPDVAHHTVLFGERFKALLQDIAMGEVPKDPSLYLHRPTATDTSLAPDGQDCFYVLAPVPNQQRKRIDWEKQAPILRADILQQLEARLMPGLSNAISTEFYLTPDYFEHELGSEYGAGFSIAPTLQQSAFFRYHNRCDDVQGLYLCGAGTHPGAGIPGVLCSAKVVERLLRVDFPQLSAPQALRGAA